MSDPFYVTSPVFSSGTVTVTIMASAGADVAGVDYNITYDATAGTYTPPTTGPAGWLIVANGDTPGTVAVSETGTTGVAISADEAVGTVTFVPAAQATDFKGAVTVTDWSTESGVEDASQYSVGSFDVLTCFVEGTLIATKAGAVPVERLAAGDQVLLAEGETAEVVWLGRRHVDCRRHPRPEQVWPVRVRAGAFGPGQPARSLFLSPAHAVFVNNILVPVKYLINGVSIEQVKVDAVSYYHVELPQHDLLLAEGLPVESYLDVGDRWNFENGGGAVTLVPDFSVLRWETEGCAKLVVYGEELERARAIVARWAMEREAIAF